jgi:serine/threonine-protein kinase
MGEVYRARDSRLGRDVALKILPDGLAADPERLARFTREAQVLASLSHPNIGAIFGIEQGPPEGGPYGTAEANVGAGFSRPTFALVLELVEGPTLADRIAIARHESSGPGLPMTEALGIAKQIASALEAAHDQGIVHRDLKPANIKIRDDGSVKVLDFGLAKLVDTGRGISSAGSARQDPAYTVSPTLISPTMMTGVGMILGTAAYMSPEQARGKEVDARVDVWAFGCVLYEMLTGRRAFPGDDITETIAAVVKDEPDWHALPRELSATVRVYLERCLAKSLRERVRSIADVRLALDGAFDVAPVATGPSPVARGRVLRRGAVTAGIALTALMAGAAVTWYVKRAPDSPAPVRRFALSAGPIPFSVATTNRDLTITPDGSHVIYFAGQGTRRRVLSRSLDSLAPVELHDADRAFEPFMSPDGKWIGYNDEFDFTLRKLPVNGGAPVTITRTGREILGATWGADDTIVYATALLGDGLWRVPAAGGTPTMLTTPDKARGEVSHSWPEFLPGGKTLVFVIRSGKNGDDFELAGLNVDTKETKRLGLVGSSPRFSPSGHLVFAAGSTLRAVRFDPARLEALSEAVPVVEGVASKAAGGSSFAIATDGTLVYVPGGAFGGLGRRLIVADRHGGRESLKGPDRMYTIPRFSPDGRSLAVDVRDQQGDIWIWSFDRQTLTRLTFDPATDQIPVWSPDSKRVFFTSTRAGIGNIYSQSADGAGEPARLADSADPQTPLSVTPDGTRLIYRSEGTPTGEDLRVLRLDGSGESTSLLQGPFNERNADVSPDGRWLAYQSNESGTYEVYVRPFPDVQTGRWQVSSGGGGVPAWAGRELFFIGADSALMSVTVTNSTSFSFSRPTVAIPAGFFVAPTSRSYDVSPDGRRIVLTDSTTTKDNIEGSMVVVLNWDDELKRLLP